METKMRNEDDDRPPRRAAWGFWAVIVFPFLALAFFGALPLLVEGDVVHEEFLRVFPSGVGWSAAALREVGSALFAGDRLRLDVEGRRPLHVYLFAVNTAGRSRTLFPDPALEIANPLPEGRRIQLPGGGSGAGWPIERGGDHAIVYLYISPKPLELAESLAETLRGAAAPAAAESAAEADAAAGQRRAFRAIQGHVEVFKMLRKLPGVLARRFVLETPAPSAGPG
jgi:hypothetical protein